MYDYEIQCAGEGHQQLPKTTGGEQVDSSGNVCIRDVTGSILVRDTY
jgi:hypothetical protein